MVPHMKPRMARWPARSLRDLLRFHLMPGWLLLLVLPGLAAVPLALLKEPREADDRWLRPAMALLGLVLAAHGPVLVRTMAHGCNTKDWIGLLPVLVLLCLLALSLLWDGVKQERLRMIAPWVLVVNGLLLAWAPLVSSLVGPDPLVEREAYRRWPLRAFTACETGYRLNTYHLVSRTPHPSRPLLQAFGKVAGEPRDDAALELAFHDLRLMPDRPGPDGIPLWRRATPDDLPNPLPDCWPAFYEGWAGLRRSPERSQTRFHLVRLRTDLPELVQEGGPQYSHRSQLTPQALASARAAVVEHFGGAVAEPVVLADPGHWFLYQVLERDSDYLGTALLVDRGSGTVMVAP